MSSFVVSKRMNAVENMTEDDGIEFLQNRVEGIGECLADFEGKPLSSVARRFLNHEFQLWEQVANAMAKLEETNA